MSNLYIVIIITLFVAFLITYSRMLYKISEAKREIAKLLVKVIVLEEYINSIEGNKIQNDESVHKENFIKFLSDSRDWAYSYIEEVQEGLACFIDSINSDIEYFDEYGDVLSINRPDYDAMKRISIAYKELKNLLPTEEVK